MSRRSFLGDMLQTLVERSTARPGTGDDRSIRDMCLSLLASEGEVSGIALAQNILDRYKRMDTGEKLAFFQFLNVELEIDPKALQGAVTRFTASNDITDYRAIGALAEPRRQELLRRLNQPTGATQALVNMRKDLIEAVKTSPDLARTDLDFKHLLRSWFNRGFLVLRQISWETPASILEKIVEYEAVHAIHDWDDLRRRLYPQDRRCFAFFHPSMPDEPLIFVEVALTMTVPNSIQHVLSENRDPRAAHETNVAVFYSISNCQAGLAGISFGSLLIKQVAAELHQELPQLETFVTLSPIPRLSKYLAEQKHTPRAAEVLSGTAEPEQVREAARDYLLSAKDAKGRPYDPVARFHLGNGAQIYAVHAEADLSENGRKQSRGAMVNYQYELSQIEQNHEKFVQEGEICLAPALRAEVKAASKKNRAMA
ncbi:malonyl-CoA decarboxylase family protein [Alphaproteobacteria bacterium KMM 3653]|uniref:Malonyl-CoA decarboxylase family protein n=1 Tax=Harenicola maris TaxID=2841044 RepID=A0AAP2CRT9_9RHOB|nr:malonyl-CoA decarboxylase family protein [Harenicola maris]